MPKILYVTSEEQLEEEACVEDFFDQLDKSDTILPDQRGAVRCELMTAFNQYRKASPLDSLITRNHLTALKELKSDDEILIQKPDKGSGLVILNCTQ